jgi:FtsH-binding integral membrane protein
MTYLDRGWWELLENRRQTSFVSSGGLFLITAVLFGLEAFTAVSRPVWLTGLVGSLGLVVAFAGLVGLYPGLRDREPRLARAGMALVAVAVMGLIVFPLCLLAETSGIPLPAPPIVAFVGAMLAIILVFVLFGAASLRSGVHSRVVGLLLLMLVATFVGKVIADLVYGGSPAAVNGIVNGIQSGILFSISYSLPADPAQDQDPQIKIISG